jgi:hypothetical protein
MPYWCAARLQPNREALALHCLGLNGYETYYPRLRDRRTRFGRTVENRPALFPGYAFVLIQLQWHTARWAPGTLGLIMDGIRSCGTARLALEDNGHDPSALLWTFVRERPESSGRELFAFCCPYRFFIDVQTKARTVW